MSTDPDLEDLRPQVLQQALQQISSTTSTPSECCIICLSDLTEQCEAQPCRHNNFDFLCLITWLHQQTTCPLCKSAVKEVRYELSHDEKRGKIYKVDENLLPSPPVPRANDGREHSEHAQLSYENEAIRRRCYIYRHNLYSLHNGSNERQHGSNSYRELFPQLFRTETRLSQRARRWLRRELLVFEYLNMSSNELGPLHRPRSSNSEYLLEYIIAILKNIDIQSSTGQAEDMITEFLGRKSARLLIHELKNWLRSSYNSLNAWDRNVQYSDMAHLPRVLQGAGMATIDIPNITLKYHEPAEARKPPLSQAWQLYVFKGDDLLEVIQLWERSVWLLGREECVVDMVTPHPSCSGQHAALQFRYIEKDHQTAEERQVRHKTEDSCIKLYLIDLDSTYGTTLNGERINVQSYLRIRHKDIMMLGGSKREYVFILPQA